MSNSAPPPNPTQPKPTHDNPNPYARYNLSLTLLDSLDTMLVMNLREEFLEAHDWVKHSLNFDIDQDVSMFETTIRVLGSLLSTYHLTRDRLYLDKAVDLAGRGLACTWILHILLQLVKDAKTTISA